MVGYCLLPFFIHLLIKIKTGLWKLEVSLRGD